MDSKYIPSDIQTYTFPELKDTLASDQVEEEGDKTIKKTEEMDEVSLREEKKQEAFKSSGFSETGESILNEVVEEHQRSVSDGSSSGPQKPCGRGCCDASCSG